jgi:WD40 repeat protein
MGTANGAVRLALPAGADGSYDMAVLRPRSDEGIRTAYVDAELGRLFVTSGDAHVFVWNLRQLRAVEGALGSGPPPEGAEHLVYAFERHHTFPTCYNAFLLQHQREVLLIVRASVTAYRLAFPREGWHVGPAQVSDSTTLPTIAMPVAASASLTAPAKPPAPATPAASAAAAASACAGAAAAVSSAAPAALAAAGIEASPLGAPAPPPAAPATAATADAAAAAAKTTTTSHAHTLPPFPPGGAALRPNATRGSSSLIDSRVEPVRGERSLATSANFHPCSYDGKHVAFLGSERLGEYCIEVRNWASEECPVVRKFVLRRGLLNAVAPQFVQCLGEWLLAVTDLRTVRIWSVRTGQTLYRLEGHGRNARIVAASLLRPPELQRLAVFDALVLSLAQDGSLVLWRGGRAAQRLQLPRSKARFALGLVYFIHPLLRVAPSGELELDRLIYNDDTGVHVALLS